MQARKRTVARAKGRLNAAFAAKVAGDTAAAQAALENAVRLDPDLIMDKSAISLTTALYGVPMEGASALLFRFSQQPIDQGHFRPTLTLNFIAVQTGLEGIALLIVCMMFATLAYLVVLGAGARALSGVPSVSRDEVSAAYRTLSSAVFRNVFGSGVQWWLALLGATLGAYWFGIILGGAGAVGRYVRYANRVYLLSYSAMIVGLVMVLGNVAGTADPTVTVRGLWLVYGAAAFSFLGMATVAALVHGLRPGRAVLSVFVGSVALLLGVLVFSLLR
jgi:hypothetical protein